MNRYLTYQEGELLFEDVALSEISEEMYTPFYVYSKAAINEKVEALKVAFADVKPMMAYAMKALDTTIILKYLRDRGCALAIENLHELERAMASGFEPTELILNSNGLPDQQLKEIVKNRPLIINVGNLFELETLNAYAAEMDMGLRIGLRINPGIDVGGHEGTNVGASGSKIGLSREELDAAIAMMPDLPQLNLVGIACALGCQVTTLAPWIKLAEDMAAIYSDLVAKGFSLEYLDIGGGFPVDYGTGEYLEIKKIARNITPKISELDCRLIVEPGRYFTAESGILVTSVLGIRKRENKNYIICDAGFSEFPRSAMYRITHEALPLRAVPSVPVVVESTPEPAAVARATSDSIDTPEELIAALTSSDEEPAEEEQPEVQEETVPVTESPLSQEITADIVGNISEGLDYLSKDVTMTEPKRGDLIAILNVGAYGRTMSSNFASCPRPPEVMIERDKFEIIRSRETIDDLIALEMEEIEAE